MPKRSIVIVLLVLMLAFHAGGRQQPDFPALERVAMEELKEKNTPGAAVAIVSGDRIVYAKGFGISNVETGASITPDMLFRIGSTTKMFTAAALVSLADQGKIKLDEPIGNHIKGLNEKIAQITAHQLLTHTAGIKDEAPMYGAHDDSALGNSVRSWKDDYLFTEPGKIISYSNPSYWLAGFLVEQVGGRPFADQMSHSLFEPLAMNRTTFRPTMAMTHPLSQGHDARGQDKPTVIRPMADNSASWPAGSMFTSANDLSRFVIAFLNGGMLEGKQILSPSVIAKLSTPYAKIPTSPQDGYGYGLMISEQRGIRVVQHGGARSGYGSIIKMAPDHRFGVIVLANRSGVSLSRTADKAMELFLPLKAEGEQTSKKELPITEAEMKKYVGVYVQGSMRFEIFIKDGKLIGKQGASEGPITKNGSNIFSIGGAQTFALVPGTDGKPEFMSLGLRAARRIREP